MADGYLLVENLIEFSMENLHLSEYDTDFLRLRLYKFFSLDYKSAKKYLGKGKLLPREKIIADLKEYIENVFSFSGNIDELICEIFGQLIPLPSQLNRNFKSLRERLGARAAIEYFYGISCSGNYVVEEDYSPIDADNGGIYVSSADRSGDEYLSDDLKTENFRAVTFEFGEKNYNFDFLRFSDCKEQAELCPSDGKPFVFDRQSIDDALSFLEYLPNLCVLSSVSGKTNENVATCDRFFAISDDLPLFKRGDYSFISSAEFPDADMSIVDYPVATVRFLTFNRNTVVELTYEIISAWNTYIDEDNGIHGNSKKAANRAFFSIKILSDGRYVVHISFTKTDDFNLYAEKKGVDSLFCSRYYPLTLAGRFVVDTNGKKIIDRAVKFVQKKLSDTDGLEPFSKLLARIEKDNAYLPNEPKARALVNEELYMAANEFLIAQSAFCGEELWLMTFKNFLSTVDIK
ncbi:MAG: hypothetical protein J6Y44_02930 [Clostridia bacterium]|nr:hypothetical protein [Clostridia bacterium]